MRRRDFIAALGGAAATSLWPLAARAQQPAMPVVGFLHASAAEGYAHVVAGFREGLKASGFIEGQNIAIAFRWANDRPDRLPALAADLVRSLASCPDERRVSGPPPAARRQSW